MIKIQRLSADWQRRKSDREGLWVRVAVLVQRLGSSYYPREFLLKKYNLLLCYFLWISACFWRAFIVCRSFQELQWFEYLRITYANVFIVPWKNNDVAKTVLVYICGIHASLQWLQLFYKLEKRCTFIKLGRVRMSIRSCLTCYLRTRGIIGASEFSTTLLSAYSS